jgi:hypothetical protein
METIAIAVICVVALVIFSMIGGAIVNRVRLKRMQQLLEFTLGQSNGRMASTRLRRKAAGTHTIVERDWGNRPYQYQWMTRRENDMKYATRIRMKPGCGSSGAGQTDMDMHRKRSDWGKANQY